MTDLSGFLLARIAEDEAVARAATDWPYSLDDSGIGGRNAAELERERDAANDFADRVTPARVLAECGAKRRIVEWHQSWPVLVETPPQFENALGDVNGMTYRLTRQIAWTTQEEYRKRFGSEPPTAPILQLLALPYAGHPDYQSEWKP